MICRIDEGFFFELFIRYYTQRGKDFSEFIEFDDLTHLVSKEKWNYIVKLQDEMNKEVTPDWRNRGFDWDLAIMDEALEALKSRDWKWWKDSANYGKVVDWDNVKVELIDILHFMISKTIVDGDVSMLYMAIATSENGIDPSQTKDNFFETFWDQFLMATVIHSTPIQVVSLIEAWYKIGSNFDEMFKMYIIKNALNRLRQKYGYKDGNYLKMWGEEEDNAVQVKLFKDVEFNIEEEDPIEKALRIQEKYYLEKVV